jgi:acetoin utilization deacetylase AcuC-like enzyme
MILSASGYGRLTQMVYDLAAEVCAGRLVLTLEGGYNLDALGASVVSSLRALQGQPDEKDPLGTITAPEPNLDSLMARIKQRHPLLATQ